MAAIMHHHIIGLQGRRALRRERVFRDRNNPLEMFSEDEVHRRYRFRPPTILFIVDMIAPSIQHQTRRNQALPALLQVLIALRFYACGTFQQVIGDTIQVSKSTVCRIVKNVSEALVRHLRRFVAFPVSPAAVNRTKQEFYKLSGFPNVIGAIDCTHVWIKSPIGERERGYVNRKGFKSLNVQMICDHRYLITNVVAKWPGSVHDSRIFRTSPLAHEFERGVHNGILLGDGGYPCKPYLMTPFINPATPERRRFNRSQTRTRVVIEQTYGILKQRFSCLRTGIRLKTESIPKVVASCVILHNIGILHHDLVEPVLPPAADQQPHDLHNLDAEDINDGFRIRQLIADTHFV